MTGITGTHNYNMPTRNDKDETSATRPCLLVVGIFGFQLARNDPEGPVIPS
jgi:hypothetical protein